MTQIGDNLKSLRTNKGWSQERLAEAAGVSQTTIDKIEKGLTIRSRYLGDIADALEVPLSAIDPSFKRHDEYDSNIGLESRTAQSSEMPLYVARGAMEAGYLYIGKAPADTISRPRILDQSLGAYGVYIPVSFMAPELEPGDIALFDDRYPVIVGSTGIFYDRSEKNSLRVVGRLVDVNESSWILQCWGLSETIELPQEEWSSADRMVGKYSKR